MRKLLFIFALLFCARAHAAICTTLSSGASQSTIQSALNSCGSGNVVAFNAGTYGPISSTVTIPCGVSMTGPVVPYQQTHYQTAILQGSSGVTQGFRYGNCSTAVTFQYLEWNGEQSSNTSGNAGGFITIQGTTSNVTIQYMWIHGMSGCNNDASHNCGGTQSNGINIGGGGGGSTTTNTVIQLNEFGSETLADCAAAMNDTATSVGGGNCNGVGIYGNTANVSVIRNIAHYLEQGFKYYEVSGYGNAYCNPFTLSYNSITQVNRISYETQCNIGTSSFPTLMYVQYNYIGNRCSQSGCTNDTLFDLSDANGCGPGAGSFCVTHTDYNVDVQNLSSNHGAGFEIWGQQGTTGSYNLIQGYVSHGGCSAFCWDTNGAFTFANNIISVYNGRYFQNGGNPAAFTPTYTGNTTNTTPAAVTSVQPTLTPSQSFSGSLNVTLSNPGTNRDTNTGIWYCTATPPATCTPSPGSGTFIPSTGGSFTVTATTYVAAVGMWGALNQPYSYPSGMGYMPSAVISATYTGGSPTTATPVISPPTGNFATAFSATITDSSPSPTIYYTTDGSTPTTASTHYTAPIPIGTVSTAVKAIATSSGLAQSAVATNTYTYLPAPPATLTGCFQSNTTNVSPFTPFVNTLNVGQSVTQHVQCQYATGASPLDCTTTDSNGSVVSLWGTLDATKLSVGAVGSGSPGLATGVSAGSTNATASVTQAATSTTKVCGQWTFTISAPATPAAPTNIQVIVISELHPW